MYSFKITKIDPADKRIDIYFTLFVDGENYRDDLIQISSDNLKNLNSDTREDVLVKMVSEECNRMMVIKDINDITDGFSNLVDVVYDLNDLSYPTTTTTYSKSINGQPIKL
jgi:hypothetical protein